MLRTLDIRTSLEALYSAIHFTLVRLKLDPRLQAFVPTFEELRVEWTAVSKKERELNDARAAAEANVDYADANLDHTSNTLAAVILVETKNNRKAPLFVRYFGAQPPSRFRRSVLGAQLTAMRTWPPSLAESQIPALVAQGEALVPQIAAADEAMMQVSTAEQEIIDFRAFGQRKQLFDKVNGARKKLYGDVSKLVYDHPAWSLTSDYVSDLFEHKASAAEPSDAELAQKIEAATEELSTLTALRDKRAQDEEAAVAERAELEKKAKLEALQAAEKEVADAAAKLAALKAQLSPDA